MRRVGNRNEKLTGERIGWLGRPLPQGEGVRKLVHAGMGLFGLLLPYLTVIQAIGCAVAAFLFNWLVLPRLFGHRFKTAREGSNDGGVLLYPLVVLALLVGYRNRVELAAFGWGVLAFGDALAGLLGQKWGFWPLPWNSRKTWQGFAGFVFGGLLGGSALALWYLVACDPQAHALKPLLSLFWFWLAWGFVPVVLGAVLESIPHGLDDNLLPPLIVPAVGLLATAGSPAEPGQGLMMAVVVNTTCAALAFLGKALRPGGVAVAWILGTTTWLAGGWRAFTMLLTFLAAGLTATFLGYGKKHSQGMAEGHGGRRGAGEVLAKGGVMLALGLGGVLAGQWGGGVVGWAVVATLAAAWADTWGSELGKLLGKRAFALPGWEEVAPGTPGAVSWAGIWASVLGAAAAVALGAVLDLEPRLPWAFGAGAAAVASVLLESLLPRLGPASHAGRNVVVTSLPLLLLVAAHGGRL